MSEWITLKTDKETRAINLACVKRVDFDENGAAHIRIVGEGDNMKHTLGMDASMALRDYLNDPMTAGRHVAGPKITP